MSEYSIQDISFAKYNESENAIHINTKVIKESTDGGSVNIQKGIKYGIAEDDLSETYATPSLYFYYTYTNRSLNEYLPLSLLTESPVYYVALYIISPSTGEELITDTKRVAVDIPEKITIESNDYKTLTGIERIHGSILYGDYIYGSSRHSNGIVRINRNDFDDITQWNITPEGSEIKGVDQIVRVGDYIYGGSDAGLIQLNTINESIKCFKGVSNAQGFSISTDGTFLYVLMHNYALPLEWPSRTRRYIGKVKHEHLLQADSNTIIAYNPDDPNKISVEAVYNIGSQGAHIDNPEIYPTDLVEEYIGAHSALTDSTYLYITFTTNAIDSIVDDYGENPRFEMHKIRKEDMTPDGWCFIPRATDDKTQTNTHIIIHPETISADVYMEDKGLCYVDKATLTPKYIPLLSHSTGTGSGYTAQIFNHYLLLSNIDKVLYILDIEDIENWDTTLDRGTYTIESFTFDDSVVKGTINETVYNEEDNMFYFFTWGASGEDSGILRYQIPGYDFSTPITVEVLEHDREIGETTVKLNAQTDERADDFTVVEKGFEFGTDPTFAEATKHYIPNEDPFSITIPELEENVTYYYRAFIEYEEEGLLVGEEKSFTIVHVYGIKGTAYTNKDGEQPTEGSTILIMKVGDSNMTAEMVTPEDGSFEYEVEDTTGSLNRYLIAGHSGDASKPIVPKLVVPKVIR